MISKIIIPDLGATSSEVILARWLVKPGDFIKTGDPVCEVTTDKANVDIESFRDGYVRALLVNVEQAVELGSEIAILSDHIDEIVEGLTQTLTPSQTETIQSKNASVSPSPQAQKTIDINSLANSAPHESKSPTETRSTEVSPELALAMFRRMSLIRRFEDYLYQLFLQGLVPGTLHQYQGQEAVAVGVCSALRTDDVIFSTHRPVGHVLAKGASVNAIAAEIWGKATGCVGGKGGQMHLMDASVNAMPSNAIVGGNMPIAVGAALGFKLRGLDRVAASFFGDGASNIGAAHEAMNLASVKNAPVVFVCENNLYAASTPRRIATKTDDFALRAKSYGMPGRVVDGMNVLECYLAALDAVEHARAGEGPTLLEFKTYRFSGHSRGDPGGYRTKEEIAQWRLRDPILLGRKWLSEKYGLAPASLDAIEAETQAQVEEAVRFAQSSPDPDPLSAAGPVYAERGAAL